MGLFWCDRPSGRLREFGSVQLTGKLTHIKSVCACIQYLNKRFGKEHYFFAFRVSVCSAFRRARRGR